MAISWDSFDKIWASTSPLTPYSFSDPNYAQGWNFIGSTPPARQMWDSIQKQNDEKFKYLRDNFGTPNIVTQASQMTDTDKIYVYLGSEAGWNSGHWYYYDEGTSSWADGGVYNSVAFVTDTTLSIAGQPADAKATGDALALKSDLAGCTFTGNVSVNADLSVTGDATIGTDLSVAGSSTLTGNVSANGDVTVTGDVSSANLTTSADATIGGDLSVTGASTLAGNITTSGDISADNISATTNATVGGNLSVTGTSTLTGNINAGADITVVGDVSADNLTTTTNATVGGSLSVAGTSTLTGNVTTNGNISAVGDISSANLTTTNATIGGNATVTGDVSCANLTTSADASVGGDLTVTGDSTLADASVNDLVVNNDLSVAGDSSLTNLSVSGTTALAGTSTAPTPSADDNSTNIATTQYVQTEIKPIEVNADIVNKRVTNIEKLLEGNLYDYQTDTDSAYTKTVPAGAMPWASLDSVGGKTLVFNQLNNNSASTATVNDVLFTNNGDGSWTVDGTASALANKGVNTAIHLIKDHKYLLRGCPSGGSNTTYYMSTNGLGALVDYGDGVIATCNADSLYGFVRPTVVSGVTVSNLKFTPQIHDLTLMYGAGNEPTTVAEFTAQFPASYYPYNAGQLMSAGVTEVVSVGKNIFNKDVVYADWTNPLVDYYYTFHLEPNTTYFCYGTLPLSSTNSANLFFYASNDSASTSRNGVWNGQTRYVTTLADGIVILRSRTAGYSPQTKEHYLSYDFMLAKSETPVSYAPYTEHTYPIPAEIQALEGYGWSAGSVYNYIDYERKVFVQCVDALDLGTLTYTYRTDTTMPIFQAGINGSGAKKPLGANTPANIVAPLYTAVSSNNVSQSGYDKGVAISADATKIYIQNSSYTNAPAFKTAMDGVYLYYELATPQEIDISQYLTDDNLISVEAGGSLTFPNSNGDDYRIDVPSAETYMVDLQASL